MIDSHHHLWNFTTEEFSWLEPSLQQSFLTAELEQTVADTDVTGMIAVQARCSAAENTFLIEQASATKLIQGIVGWADLKADNRSDILDHLAEISLVKGIREITQGTDAEEYLLNREFNAGIDLLESRNLNYDLLIFENQLSEADQFVARHSNLPIVLDHCAKPSIQKNSLPQQWVTGINKLANHENLSCKLSGLPTEIRDGSECTPELLRPYFETILEAFTPQRIMFGSDWPVSQGAVTYSTWLNCVKALISELSTREQEAILTGTASEFYNI